jgi:hypothetical protein
MIGFATMALTTTCDKFTERTGAGASEPKVTFILAVKGLQQQQQKPG